MCARQCRWGGVHVRCLDLPIRAVAIPVKALVWLVRHTIPDGASRLSKAVAASAGWVANGLRAPNLLSYK